MSYNHNINVVNNVRSALGQMITQQSELGNKHKNYNLNSMTTPQYMLNHGVVDTICLNKKNS